MAKQSLRNLSRSQWFYVVAPSFAGTVTAWFGREEMELPLPLYIVGGGFALSLLLGFLMVYGEEL